MNSTTFFRQHPLIQIASERDGLTEMEEEGEVALICKFRGLPTISLICFLRYLYFNLVNGQSVHIRRIVREIHYNFNSLSKTINRYSRKDRANV